MDTQESPEGMTDKASKLRVALSNEWHARPLLSLPSPLRCSHLVCLRGSASLSERRRQFAEFCRDQGQSESGAHRNWPSG